MIPDGEDFRRAIKWISGQLQENPGQPVKQFIHQATLKFDLSPKDAESLIYFYAERKDE